VNQRRFLSGVLAAVAMVLATLASASLSPAGALTNCTVSAADLAVDTEEQQMLDLINDYRLARGLPRLTFDANTNRAAAWMSRDMAENNRFSHIDSLGRDVPTRVTQCDVTWTSVRENLAAGKADAEATFEQWRTSTTGHKENMLAGDVSRAGVARAYDASSTHKWYWTLNLTHPGGPVPTTTSTAPTTTTTTVVSPTTTTTAPTTTVVFPTTTTSPATVVFPTTTTAPRTTVVFPTTTPAPTTTVVFPATTVVFPTVPTAPPTTTVVPPTRDDECASIQAGRDRFNAQITEAEQTAARLLSGSQLDAAIAALEAKRAQGNASFDQRLANCTAATTPTTAPTTTTTLVLPPTTTTVPPTGDSCAEIRANRLQFNTRIAAIEATLAQAFSGSQRAAAIALLDATRAQGNAGFDQQAAAEGCPPPS